VSKIVWCDPPPNTRTAPSRWVEKLNPFLERPGQWGIVQTWAFTSYSAANQARHRLITNAYMPGKWEFMVSKLDDCVALFVRYLGPDEDVNP
jgi:hypothetical protein